MSYSKAIRIAKEKVEKVWDAKKEEWVSPPKKTTYKVWFKIYGELKWVTAFKEWDTKEEATNHALEKFRNWTATEDWTVTKTGVDPNETKGE